MGESGIEQANEVACWSALLHVGNEYNYRWQFFQQCISSLYLSERDDMSLRLLLDVMKKVTSREALKAILVAERQKNNANYFRAKPSKVYEKNIDKLLIILNE